MLFCNFSNIFLLKCSELIWNVQFWPFCNFSNIFLPKWSKLIQNGQFWPFCTFSNISLPKWSNLIQNSQFGPFCNFSNIFWIDSEWPNLAVLQLFQYFPTEVVRIDVEWPILAVLQLFQYFPTKVVQIHLEWPILAVLQLFEYFPTKMVQIDFEWPILAILQLFQYFPTVMAWKSGYFIFFNIFLKHFKWTRYLSWLHKLMLCFSSIGFTWEIEWDIDVLNQLWLLGHLLYLTNIIMKWQKVYSISLHCIPCPGWGFPLPYKVMLGNSHSI